MGLFHLVLQTPDWVLAKAQWFGKPADRPLSCRLLEARTESQSANRCFRPDFGAIKCPLQLPEHISSVGDRFGGGANVRGLQALET